MVNLLPNRLLRMTNELEFAKVHGTGNDFILVDGRRYALPVEAAETYAGWCNRHTGIGADGLIVLMPHPALAFDMRYYNADGHPGSLCGNGGRCAVYMAHQWGLLRTREGAFQAADGPHQGIVQAEGHVEISMRPLDYVLIRALGPDRWFADTGSPHVVIYLPPDADLTAYDVATQGRVIRWDPAFPGGTNVNFVQTSPQGTLQIRTFERGVEAETLACGTGVTAAAVIHAQRLGLQPPWALPVLAVGGLLRVTADATGMLHLAGPVQPVYTGKLPLPDRWQ